MLDQIEGELFGIEVPVSGTKTADYSAPRRVRKRAKRLTSEDSMDEVNPLDDTMEQRADDIKKMMKTQSISFRNDNLQVSNSASFNKNKQARSKNKKDKPFIQTQQNPSLREIHNLQHSI